MLDDASGSGFIEVFVRDMDQLFQSLDPSPFHHRELDDKADRYIVDSARELPHQDPRGLLIYVDRAAISDEERDSVAAAVRRHFARCAMMARGEMHQHFRRARASLAVGLPVLGSAVAGGEILSRIVDVQPLDRILRESLLIGGWVAMWRPIELFLYDWWPIRDRRRILERLSRIEVRILPSASAPERADRVLARQ
jgi:hypothetical protein